MTNLNRPSQRLEEIASSDLLKLSFELRSETISAAEASDLVRWLVDEFMLKRCVFLASAITRTIGRDHLVTFRHLDGRIAHSVVACSPQLVGDLRGSCVDVLGRRPLRQIRSQIEDIAGDTLVPIVGQLVETGDYDDGEEEDLLALAGELPWLRSVMRHEALVPSGTRLTASANRLGYRAMQTEDICR